MFIDFGQIGEVISRAVAASQTEANPIAFGKPVDFNDFVIGDIINAQIAAQVQSGGRNIFMWGHTKWGSPKLKVGP